MAARYPAYLASLNLKDEEGHALTADNYLDYLKKLLIRSAQEAKDAGATIPDSLGFTEIAIYNIGRKVKTGAREWRWLPFLFDYNENK